MSVEMQQLRHFAVLAEIRHFGRAARTLSLSQPALSRSIRNLEERLRVRLLERSRAGVQLTPVGELFLQRARGILSEVTRAVQEIDSLSGRIVGSASIGVTPSFDQFLVPDVLAGLVDRSGQVHLSIRSGFYEDLLVLVRTGEIDLALALMPEVHGHPDVIEEVLLTSQVQVYCRPGHPLAGRAGLVLADVADQAWIVPDQPALRQFERWFESNAAHRPRYVIRTASMQLLKETMQRCDLLSLLPDHLVARELAQGALVPLAVTSLPRSLHVALITRRRGTLPMVAASIAEAIRAAFAKHRGTTVPTGRSPRRHSRPGR